MREPTLYAVLSDIHGNVLALRAVIADARCRNITRFINLGDIVYGPLWPKETRKLLETIAPITIQGNQDREIHEASDEQITSSPTLRHAVQKLGTAGVAWLRSLPKEMQIDSDGCTIRLTHGTPADDCIYLLEDIHSGTAQLRDPAEIKALLADDRASLVLCGHSHIPRSVRLHNGSAIVNPGSVGLPAYDDELPVYHRMETYSPMASYAIVEIEHGAIAVELLRVPYDHQAAAQRARENNRADWAAWIETGLV